jgi:RHS repeat-associated protein
MHLTLTYPVQSGGRFFTRGNVRGYCFGFNGQLKDDEVYGEGNSYTAEYWQYDPRLGRRWNIDPIDQISISNYACFENNPLFYVDIKGDHIDPSGLKSKDVETYNELKLDWQKQTGLILYENEQGYLDYRKNEKGKAIVNLEGTSKTGRKLLMKTIDNDKKTLYLDTDDHLPEIDKGTQFIPASNDHEGKNRIVFNRLEVISFASDWQGDEKYRNQVMNFGIVGFHELIHFSKGYHDVDYVGASEKSTITPGLTVNFENKIRKELGYLLRYNYGVVGDGYHWIAFDKISHRELKNHNYQMTHGNFIKTNLGKLR